MHMNTEKLDRVVLFVQNLDASTALYSELLGIEFDEIPMADVSPVKMVPGDERSLSDDGVSQPDPLANWRVAISRVGLELIEGALEPDAAPRVACFHFKVDDYEAAKAEMATRGIALQTDITLGQLREAMYNPQGDQGPMMGLVSYPHEYVMDSIKAKG